MMTPREQALDFFFSFKYENNYGIEANTGVKGVNYEQAKQCTLIAIDLVLKEIQIANPSVNTEWWLEVKKEAEKL